METNWIAWLFMGLFFFPYWIVCLSKFGLTDSISATWYSWEKLTLFENKKMFNKTVFGKFWFTIMIIGTTTPIFAFIPEGGHSWEFLLFIGVGGLWLTATAAAYKKAYVEKYHVYGSIVGIVFCLLAVGVVFNLWVPAIILAIVTSVFYGFKVPGATNIVEALSVITIWGSLAVEMIWP